MKFDIVIGNPPYNNDIYVDFVNTLNNVKRQFQIMITPSKWAAKTGDSNKEFRDNIVPYISDLVFYPETREVFDIAVPDGISYYLIGNTKVDSKRIVNICNRQKAFNSTEVRDMGNHINNKANSIINKIRAFNETNITPSSDRTYFIKPNESFDENGDIRVYGGNQDGSKLLYGKINRNRIQNHVDDIDKYKVVIQFKFGNGIFTMGTDGKTLGLKNLNIYEPEEICKDDYLVLFTTNNINEAESYKSYLYTKFVRFLVWAGCVGSNASNSETWRFVPEPLAYDHIFTDEELFKKYQLSNDDIEFINNFMKERD